MLSPAMSSHRTLPYVDPRASHGPLYRAYVRFLRTRVAAWLSRNVVWKVDPHVMRLTLVLGADVAHFADGLDDHRFPIFGDDHAAQGRSAERLKALRNAGHTVLPGHDPEVLRPGPLSTLLELRAKM